MSLSALAAAWALLGIGFAAPPQNAAAPILVTPAGRVSLDEALARIAKADVVFIGENHDHRAGHEFERVVLDYVSTHRKKTVLALEMFERDLQLVVDEYLAGHITETAFLAASRPWPAYKTDYRPLVELCKERRLPVVASNAPRRYVNIVSRSGPDALLRLPAESRRYLAPLPVDPTMAPAYAAELDELFGGAHGSGAPAAGMPSAENMKAAQTLWDATMAESVVRASRRYRGALVLHINGAMHSDSGYGIVERVKRLAPRLKVLVVTMKPDPAYPAAADADYAKQADIAAVFPPEGARAPAK